HDAHPPLSRLHSNVDMGLFLLIRNVAFVEATRPDGPLVRETSGATVSPKRAVTYIVPVTRPVPNVQIPDASGASSQSISFVCGWSNPMKRCPPAQVPGIEAWISGSENVLYSAEQSISADAGCDSGVVQSSSLFACTFLIRPGP